MFNKLDGYYEYENLTIPPSNLELANNIRTLIINHLSVITRSDFEVFISNIVKKSNVIEVAIYDLYIIDEDITFDKFETRHYLGEILNKFIEPKVGLLKWIYIKRDTWGWIRQEGDRTYNNI
jgi:hypothetical protein